MLRNVGLVTGWLAATAAVVALGWMAVGAVAGAVSDPPPLVQPPALEEPRGEEPPQEPPEEAPVEQPDPGDGEAPQGEVRTFELEGGTVAVRDAGATVALVFASPRSGFTVDVRLRGPERVDVRFSSAAHESRFRYDAGAAERVEERPE